MDSLAADTFLFPPSAPFPSGAHLCQMPQLHSRSVHGLGNDSRASSLPSNSSLLHHSTPPGSRSWPACRRVPAQSVTWMGPPDSDLAPAEPRNWPWTPHTENAGQRNHTPSSGKLLHLNFCTCHLSCSLQLDQSWAQLECMVAVHLPGADTSGSGTLRN